MPKRGKKGNQKKENQQILKKISINVRLILEEKG